MIKNLISIRDLSVEEIEEIFALASSVKEKLKRGEETRLLAGKTLAMIFEKPSLRTRVTFELGMTQLGGHAIYLAPSDIRIGVRESVSDCAHNLERWVDGIMARTFSHDVVVELADHASIPVINALTDKLHPCQVLTDCFTLKEHLGSIEDKKVAFLGDGNNVANSWLYAAAKLRFSFAIACPENHEPAPDVLTEAREKAGDRILMTRSVAEAVAGAHVIYTDSWTSMGQEAESEQRRKTFAPYQVNSSVVEQAQDNVVVMHCLPAHRGEEITDDVLDGPHSIALDQAENRLHVQKAILTLLMQDQDCGCSPQ